MARQSAFNSDNFPLIGAVVTTSDVCDRSFLSSITLLSFNRLARLMQILVLRLLEVNCC
jgi:hypothetical protein